MLIFVEFSFFLSLYLLHKYLRIFSIFRTSLQYPLEKWFGGRKLFWPVFVLGSSSVLSIVTVFSGTVVWVGTCDPLELEKAVFVFLAFIEFSMKNQLLLC